MAKGDAEFRIPKGTDPTLARAIRRYWSVWDKQREKIIEGHDKALAFSSTPGVKDIFDSAGGPLGPELLSLSNTGIAIESELKAIAAATEEELRARPPVVVSITNSSSYPVHVLGEGVAKLKDSDLSSLDELAAIMRRQGAHVEDIRAAYRRFAQEFWHYWDASRSPNDLNVKTPQMLPWPSQIPQSTFEEVKRLARGFALAPKGLGWSEDADDIALIHDEHNRARYNLRLERALIPEWFGRPNDSSSLMIELKKIGPHATAILLISVGLLVMSADGNVDFDIDSLLSRAGIDPRSSKERISRRYEAWRILTLIGATRVVGERRSKIYDRTVKRHVEIESTDPLITVSPWVERGSQISFDASTPPFRVAASAGRLIKQWRGNRSALQYFGDVIAISSIPSGKPSGEWARVIGFALQQLWREDATKAKYGRAGDDHRITAKFPAYTRRRLLQLFPPATNPVEDVLESQHPQRAIQYWNQAIQELRERHIIGVYDGSRDWAKNRPRKAWDILWLDEPLTIEPSRSGVVDLASIAGAAKKRGKKTPTRLSPNSKLAESVH